MLKRITIKISNPNSCEQCMQAVNNSVKVLPGIISITITPETSRFQLMVSYESGNVSFETIRNTISELGYTIDGYIIHEHVHAHGDIFHDHPHTHGDLDKEHYHIHSENNEKSIDEGADTMATDPVCKMKVIEEKAAAKTDYKGNTYYFCAKVCKEKFEKEPEKYLQK